jgi:hypothetical protein
MKKTLKFIGITALAAVIGFMAASCDNGTGGGSSPTSATYTSYDGDRTEYKLVITKAAGRAAYNPKSGDSYKLTITFINGDIKISTGTVESVTSVAIKLKPNGGETTVTVTVSSTGNTIISFSADIPINGGEEEVEKPGTLTPTDPGGEQPPAHTHVWGAWTQTKAPTETTDGEETRVCSLDPTHKETRILYATGTPGLEFGPVFTNNLMFVGYGVITAGTATSGAVYIPAYHRIDANVYEPVTAISSAFVGTSITSITIPASVTDISSTAFNGCRSLTNITVTAGNPNFSSEGGILYNKAKTELLDYPSASGNVTISSNVKSIGENAFAVCDSLTSITIPTSVTSIGNMAFAGCESLTSITIPASVTSIGENAFIRCTSLTSITIPASITSIGKDAFHSCSNLTSINVASNNPNYASEGGIFYNKAKTELIQAPQGISGSVTIPASVTSIGEWAFFRCSLTSITIPSSVTSIGAFAFSQCSSLTTVTFAEGSRLETFGVQEAFAYCTSLTSITIPASVTDAGWRTFGDWTASQTIYVLGYASEEAADSAWNSWWRIYCNAVIKYWNGSAFI